MGAVEILRNIKATRKVSQIRLIYRDILKAQARGVSLLEILEILKKDGIVFTNCNSLSNCLYRMSNESGLNKYSKEIVDEVNNDSSKNLSIKASDPIKSESKVSDPIKTELSIISNEIDKDPWIKKMASYALEFFPEKK